MLANLIRLEDRSHVGDISFAVLGWHVGVVAVFAGLAGWAGPRLLAWRNAPLAT